MTSEMKISRWKLKTEKSSIQRDPPTLVNSIGPLYGNVSIKETKKWPPSDISIYYFIEMEEDDEIIIFCDGAEAYSTYKNYK